MTCPTLVGELRDAIPVTQVPKHLPVGPNGKPTHLASVYRFHTRGRRGVKLEFTYVAGRTYGVGPVGRRPPHQFKSPKTLSNCNYLRRSA